jgi:hypothetical protein
MEKKSKFCQSCMMPMKQDPAGGGTNADSTKSEKYCSYCYADGKFTQPDITANQMQKFVVDKMVEMKYPRFLARFMTMQLPKLDRWQGK